MKSGALLVAFCLPAAAQFTGLAVTDDGARVYFSTTLRERGTDQPAHGKIWVVDDSGARLYAMRPEVPPERPVFPDPRLSNFFYLWMPDVSGDGVVVSFAGAGYCTYSNRCVSVETAASTLTGLPQGEATLPGQVRLSANGRYALSVPGNRFAAGVYVADLPAGTRTAVSGAADSFSPRGRVIADDGTAVLTNSGAVTLIRGGTVEFVRGQGQEYVGSAVIDAAGTKVVYEARPWLGTVTRLRRLDVATREDRVLGDGNAPSLSNDGRRLLFLRDGQAYVMNLETAAADGISDDPDGVADAALSGNGRVAFLLTRAGRLVRRDLDTGTERELIGRTPFVEAFNLGCPGGITRLAGAGFGGDTGVTIDGLPAPVVAVSPAELRLQVPWDTPAGDAKLTVENDAGSRFEPPAATLRLFPSRPEFARLGPEWPMSSSDMQPYLLAVHGAWDALVTPAKPARPGEIVHLYASGLGPVDQPVRAGEPGPSEPLARLAAPFHCTYYQGSEQREIEVFYAGLAPGIVGYYQVSLRVPADFARAEFFFGCRAEGAPDSAGGALPVAQRLLIQCRRYEPPGPPAAGLRRVRPAAVPRRFLPHGRVVRRREGARPHAGAGPAREG